MRHTKYAPAIMAVIACEGAEKNEVTLPVKPLATSELDAAKQGADDPTRKPGVSVGPHGVALGAKTLARLEPAGFRCSASLPTQAMRRAVPYRARKAPPGRRTRQACHGPQRALHLGGRHR